MRPVKAVILIALCSLGCIFSMFHRSSLAVLINDISSSLSLGSQEVGLLGALYLYAFALNQLPLGMLLARYGPRLIMSLCLALAALGALLVGLAEHAWMALLGRFFMGLGMSASFMGSLLLLAGWFSARRFGLLSGVVAGLATLGGLMATTPLIKLAGWLGWRGVFVFLAITTGALAVAFWLLVANPPQAEAPAGLRSSLRMLLGRARFWGLGLASAARYGFFVAVQSTWAGPFLLWGMGLSQEETARLLFILIIGYMLGMPLSGFFSDRMNNRKLIVMLGLAGQAMVAVCMPGLTNSAGLGWLMLAFGLFSAPGILIYAHAKEILPASAVAPALTWINFFTILAGGLLTQLMGHWLPENLAAIKGAAMFNPLWYAGLASVALALIVYAFLPARNKPANYS